MMKHILISLLCMGMVAAFTACGDPASSDAKTEEPVAALELAQLGQKAVLTSVGQAQQQTAEVQKIHVADAALFRGTVEEFAVGDNGNTVLIMNRQLGSDFQRTMKVELTNDTQYGFDGQIGNGAFLEVFYSGNSGDIVTAIAINDLGIEEMVNYNGALVELKQDGDSGQLVMDPLDEGGMQYIFNYGPETQFYLDLDALKPGDQLNVYHSMISTRSLPPQSPALEVRLYTAPEKGEIPTPAADGESIPVVECR